MPPVHAQNNNCLSFYLVTKRPAADFINNYKSCARQRLKSNKQRKHIEKSVAFLLLFLMYMRRHQQKA